MLKFRYSLPVQMDKELLHSHDSEGSVIVQELDSIFSLPIRIYRIYSAIRRGFHLSRMTTNNLISSM